MLDPVFFLQQSASPPRCISRGERRLPAGVTPPGGAGLRWGVTPPPPPPNATLAGEEEPQPRVWAGRHCKGINKFHPLSSPWW